MRLSRVPVAAYGTTIARRAARGDSCWRRRGLAAAQAAQALLRSPPGATMAAARARHHTPPRAARRARHREDTMRSPAEFEVLATLEARVAPAHTALLVVDMQNDYCAAGGASD